jgi:hypothetical protein
MLIATTDTFIRAFFTDDKKNTIMVMSKKEDETVHSQRIPVNPDFLDFQELLKLTTIDDIEKESETEATIARKAFENYHKQLIDNNIITPASKENISEDLFNFILKYDETNDKHKELLFELKLLSFDNENIEDAESEVKEAIRTAITPMELLNILREIV